MGQIVQDEWLRTRTIRPEIVMDEFIVMPDHLHAIVSLGEQWFVRAEPGILERSKRSLGSLVAGFKSICTLRINSTRRTPGKVVWQRNYYEHVIRTEVELERIREYIRLNPARGL